MRKTYVFEECPWDGRNSISLFAAAVNAPMCLCDITGWSKSQPYIEELYRVINVSPFDKALQIHEHVLILAKKTGGLESDFY